MHLVRRAIPWPIPVLFYDPIISISRDLSLLYGDIFNTSIEGYYSICITSLVLLGYGLIIDQACYNVNS